MGRVSKAKRVRIQNLKNLQNSSVQISGNAAQQQEDDESDTEYLPGLEIRATFVELEAKGIIPHWEDEPEEDSDGEEVDEEAEAEVHDDATFLTFTSRMQEAQLLLEAQEHEAEALRKRPKRYLGNSERTRYRNAAKRRKIQAEGKQKFLTDFWKKSKPELMVIPEAIDISSTEELSDVEEVEVEVASDVVSMNYFVFYNYLTGLIDSSHA
ncbi:hypothetical protein M422DRAFT_51149 [Sphaerobolus stellatus SS14]|uniref:Uncharacterized protein n=1 Tax=Sphaerobolus stellatus (strain SS14) TaxID=990650 RepID=A0A0C9UMZ1_SPHS4|nr:hypothetical protein M422DRAFT_51149 [Sphaerobolus stellatus SS14]